jgi:hypothetical protein
MTESEKVYMLKDALMMLLDQYKCSVPNECQCEDEYECAYCYTQEVLKKCKDGD